MLKNNARISLRAFALERKSGDHTRQRARWDSKTRPPNRPFPSYPLPVSKRVYVENHSHKNEFDRLQVNFHANQTNFHLNSFSRRLVFKQRQRVTRKWPIRSPLLCRLSYQARLAACFSLVDLDSVMVDFH